MIFEYFWLLKIMLDDWVVFNDESVVQCRRTDEGRVHHSVHQAPLSGHGREGNKYLQDRQALHCETAAIQIHTRFTGAGDLPLCMMRSMSQRLCSHTCP